MSDNKRYSIVLGITGGIACGKSEVGRILRDLGFVVCDSDHVAHGLMAKGMAVHQRIVECFGDHVLDGSGEISRSALGTLVFDDPEKLSRLNRLIHPAVRVELQRWIAERRSNGDSAAVQIPLLFESGMDTLDWDAVVCVSSKEDQVCERIAARGINLIDARKRIAAQMPLGEKERLSDRVIRNFGTLQELEEATRKTVESLIVER